MEKNFNFLMKNLRFINSYVICFILSRKRMERIIHV